MLFSSCELFLLSESTDTANPPMSTIILYEKLNTAVNNLTVKNKEKKRKKKRKKKDQKKKKL